MTDSCKVLSYCLTSEICIHNQVQNVPWFPLTETPTFSPFATERVTEPCLVAQESSRSEGDHEEWLGLAKGAQALTAGSVSEGVAPSKHKRQMKQGLD